MSQTRVFIFIVCLMSLAQAGTWWEPTNTGVGPENASDWKAPFLPENEHRFHNAFLAMDVFMFPVSRYVGNKEYRGFFASRIVPKLKKYKIQLALDSTRIMALGCKSPVDQAKTLQNEVDFINALQSNAGISISYIAIQSILSKPRGLYSICDNINYNTPTRIDDIVRYSKKINDNFGSKIKIGIIDAKVAKKQMDYKVAYQMLINAMVKQGLKLSFIQIDHPFSKLKSNQDLSLLKEAAQFIKSRGVRSQLILNNDTSLDQASFIKESRTYLELIHGQVLIDDYVQYSWYKSTPLDVPNLSLVIDFAEAVSGSSFYDQCTVEYYLKKRPDVANHSYFRKNVMKHFVHYGKVCWHVYAVT